MSLAAWADRQDVVDTIVRYASALDAKDWAAARSCFTDEIEADYADLRGSGPERLAAQAFVDLRRRALEGLKTHHMSTNHLVTLDGDRASCVSAMLIHRLDPRRRSDNTFDTLAHYTHDLVRTARGWRIARVQQRVAWNRGNPAVHSGAHPASRAGRSRGRTPNGG
jgi:3-phenylpropionate/cinnamic acid dioxygenase small subunit